MMKQLTDFRKGGILVLLCFCLTIAASSQTPVADTLKSPADSSISVFDTTDIDFDFLMDEFANFLDSISRPRSYFLAGISMGKGYYNYLDKSSIYLQPSEQFTYSPSATYFHKSGLNLTATGNIVNDGENLNLYQVFVSPGFDYLKNKRFATGLSYTRYFTKDSLPFYTTPIQNELYTYFTYRKSWFKPSISLSYGWGSRTDYEQREYLIEDLRLRARGFTRVNTQESISDLSLVASVRHDFYWLGIFTSGDHIRISPQFNFTSGTQKFGFNQSTNSYATLLRNGANVLYNSENTYLNDELKFQPLALTFYLRTEYSIGKFYIQPQLIIDYYFPASTDKLSTLLSFNAGVLF